MNKDNKISVDGGRWLLSALDPFHDYQMRLEGFPDDNSAYSYVENYTTSISVSAPTGETNWDCEVLFTGLDGSSTMKWLNTSIGYNNRLQTFNISDEEFGYTSTSPLTIKTGPAGDAMDPTSEVKGLFTRPVLDAYTYGRLIGVGIEVHNVTAEIYKQGTCTVAMLPEGPDAISDRTTLELIETSGTTSFKAQINPIPLGPWPTTESHVRVIPGSSQWPASKGVYMIPRMRDHRPPTSSGLNREYYMYREHWSTGSTSRLTFPEQIETQPYFVAAAGPTMSSFLPEVAFFTGLSPATTLRVTLRAIVELFPSCLSDKIIFVTPSPALDIAALEAYARAVKDAPYAVTVGQNAAGDYFRSMLRVLRGVAPAAAMMISSPSVPGGVELGRALIANIGSEVRNRRVKRGEAGGSAMATRK